jgi:hypothetical protein
MAGAVAKWEENSLDAHMPVPSRAEVLARYHRLREISRHHHCEAMNFLSPDAVLNHARRLGLASGRTFLLDDFSDMTYPLDLAIHTAAAGRTRAIDRYARSVSLAPGSDEAVVLQAMRNAKFALIRVLRRHETAGLIVADLFRRSEVWLVDEGMERSFSEGGLMATRLYRPDSFSMTAGVGVLFDAELLEDVICEVPQLTRKRPEEAVDDRRFAEAAYRLALESGLTEHLVYEDPVAQAG